jgi:hypothetical protein
MWARYGCISLCRGQPEYVSFVLGALPSQKKRRCKGDNGDTNVATVTQTMEQNLSDLLVHVDMHSFDIPDICNLLETEMKQFNKKKLYGSMIVGIDIISKIIEHSEGSAFNYVPRVCLAKQLPMLYQTTQQNCIIEATKRFLTHVDLEMFSKCDDFIEIAINLAVNNMDRKEGDSEVRSCGLLMLRKLIEGQKIDIHNDSVHCFVSRIVAVCLPDFADHLFQHVRAILPILAENSTAVENVDRVLTASSRGPAGAELSSDETDVARRLALSYQCIALLMYNISPANYARLVITILTVHEDANKSTSMNGLSARQEDRDSWKHLDQLINMYAFLSLTAAASSQQQQTQFIGSNLSHILLLYIRELLFAISVDYKQVSGNSLRKQRGTPSVPIDLIGFWNFPKSPFGADFDTQLVEPISEKAAHRVRIARSLRTNSVVDKKQPSSGSSRGENRYEIELIQHYRDFLQLVKLVNFVETSNMNKYLSEVLTKNLTATKATNDEDGNKQAKSPVVPTSSVIVDTMLASMATAAVTQSITDSYTVLDDLYTVLCLLYDTVLRSPCCRHSIDSLLDIINTMSSAKEPISLTGNSCDKSKQSSSQLPTLNPTPSSKSLRRSSFDVTKILNNSFQLPQNRSDAQLYFDEEELLHSLLEQIWRLIAVKAANVGGSGEDHNSSNKCLVLPAMVQFLNDGTSLIHRQAKTLVAFVRAQRRPIAHQQHLPRHHGSKDSAATSTRAVKSRSGSIESAGSSAEEKEADILRELDIELSLDDQEDNAETKEEHGGHDHADSGTAKVVVSAEVVLQELTTCLTQLVLGSMQVISNTWLLGIVGPIGLRVSVSSNSSSSTNNSSSGSTNKDSSHRAASNSGDGTILLAENCVSLLNLFLSQDWQVAKLVTAIVTNVLAPRINRNGYKPFSLADLTIDGNGLGGQTATGICEQLLFGDRSSSSHSGLSSLVPSAILNSTIVSYVRNLMHAAPESTVLQVLHATNPNDLPVLLSSMLSSSSASATVEAASMQSFDVSWFPLDYHCVVLLRDAIFNSLCSVYEEQPLWTVACWDLQLSLIRAFGLPQILDDIPMLLALETFCRVFPLDNVSAERYSECVHMLAGQRLFFVAYFTVLAKEVIVSGPLRDLITSIHGEWANIANGLPAGIALNVDTCQLVPASTMATSKVTAGKNSAAITFRKPKSLSGSRLSINADKENAVPDNRKKAHDDENTDADDDHDVLEDNVVIRAAGGGKSSSPRPSRADQSQSEQQPADLNSGGNADGSHKVLGRRKSKLLSIPSAVFDLKDPNTGPAAVVNGPSDEENVIGNESNDRTSTKSSTVPVIDVDALMFAVDASLPRQDTQLRSLFRKAFQSSYAASPDLHSRLRQLDIQAKQRAFLRANTRIAPSTESAADADASGVSIDLSAVPDRSEGVNKIDAIQGICQPLDHVLSSEQRSDHWQSIYDALHEQSNVRYHLDAHTNTDDEQVYQPDVQVLMQSADKVRNTDLDLCALLFLAILVVTAAGRYMQPGASPHFTKLRVVWDCSDRKLDPVVLVVLKLCVFCKQCKRFDATKQTRHLQVYTNNQSSTTKPCQ